MSKLKIAFLFFVVFIACGVCAVPWPGSWGTSVTGSDKGGVRQSLWAFDHGKNAMFLGAEFGRAAKINPPTGENLYPHVPMGFPIIWAPVTNLLGLLVAYNLAAWFGLFLSFLCAYLLFWEVSGDFWPGVIGGAAFIFSPYILFEIGAGQITTGAAFIVPLALFFLIRFLDNGAFIYGLLAVLTISAAILFSFAYGLLLLVFAICAAVAAVFDEGAGAFFRGITAAVVPVVLALPFISNLYLPDVTFLAGNSIAGIDFFGFLQKEGASNFLFPVLPLVGAVAATFFLKNNRGFWWIMAAVFLLLSFGHNLFPADLKQKTFLLELIPGFPKIIDPYRFLVGVQITLCALLAMGVRSVLEKLEKKEKDESLVTRGLFLLIIVFGLIIAPKAIVLPATPTIYNSLDKQGAILILPHSSTEIIGKSLYFQTVHKKDIYIYPALNHDSVFIPPYPKMTQKIFIEADKCEKENKCDGFLETMPGLIKKGVRHVAINKTGGEVLERSPLYKGLVSSFGIPIYSDDDLAVFFVDYVIK